MWGSLLGERSVLYNFSSVLGSNTSSLGSQLASSLVLVPYLERLLLHTTLLLLLLLEEL
jgi:hypothetical protein